MKTILHGALLLIALLLVYFLSVSFVIPELFIWPLLLVSILLPMAFGWKHYYVTVYNTLVESGVNDNSSAVYNFKKQIQKTKKSICIFDDGNYMEGSIYNDQGVVDLLEKKITQEKINLNIQFNNKDDLLINKLVEYDKVQIRYNPKKNRDPNENHFRISDEGRYCYISKHKHGVEKRVFDVYQKSIAKLPFFNLDEEYPDHPVAICKKKFQSQERIYK